MTRLQICELWSYYPTNVKIWCLLHNNSYRRTLLVTKSFLERTVFLYSHARNYDTIWFHLPQWSFCMKLWEKTTISSSVCDISIKQLQNNWSTCDSVQLLFTFGVNFSFNWFFFYVCMMRRTISKCQTYKEYSFHFIFDENIMFDIVAKLYTCTFVRKEKNAISKKDINFWNTTDES